MRSLFLASAVLLSSLTAQASGFPTMNAFELMTSRQMAALPEIRVPLCRRLNVSALQGRTKLELSLMKNSIFAQVGYKFSNASYRRYFLTRRWYNENSGYRADRLCAADNENARLLSALIARAKDSSSESESGYGEEGYGYGEEGYGYGYGSNGYGYGSN